MKSKATGCGSISTVFPSIVLQCISSIIIIIIIIIIIEILMVIIMIKNKSSQPAITCSKLTVEAGKCRLGLECVFSNYSD